MGLLDDIRNGNMDDAELLELVTSNDLAVALAVADSEYAPRPVLDIAAHDKDRLVRLAVAGNSKTGLRTLAYLCSDRDGEVAQRARSEIDRRKKHGMVL